MNIENYLDNWQQYVSGENSSANNVFMNNCVINISRFVSSLVNTGELANFTLGATNTRLVDVKIDLKDNETTFANIGLRAKLDLGSSEVNIEKSTLELSGCRRNVLNQGANARMELSNGKLKIENSTVKLMRDKSCIANVGPGAEIAHLSLRTEEEQMAARTKGAQTYGCPLEDQCDHKCRSAVHNRSCYCGGCCNAGAGSCCGGGCYCYHHNCGSTHSYCWSSGNWCSVHKSCKHICKC